jgi:hypothetical protein
MFEMWHLEEFTLTWGHEPPSGLGSEAPIVVAAAAPVVTTTGLSRAVVVVVSNSEEMVAKGSGPSARPGPEVRPP